MLKLLFELICLHLFVFTIYLARETYLHLNNNDNNNKNEYVCYDANKLYAAVRAHRLYAE